MSKLLIRIQDGEALLIDPETDKVLSQLTVASISYGLGDSSALVEIPFVDVEYIGSHSDFTILTEEEDG